MADNLTMSEAVEFLEGVLQVKSPVEKLKEDRVGFLNDVIGAFLQKIPFQSLTAIATPKPERRKLTFEEIKACMMTRQGGLCCDMNYFMKVLLERLGYEVYHVGCDVLGKSNSHLSTVLRSMNHEGDMHLVEVGAGFPTFSPMPLDFDRESPLYETGSATHKFVKEADGTIRWMHKAHSDFLAGPGIDVVDGWYAFMVFKIVFRDIEFFSASMENIRTVEGGPEALSPFLVSLRAMDFRNGRLLAIRDKSLLEEDSSGKVNKKRMSSPDELLNAYKTLFPQFPAETVQQALQTVDLKFEN